MVGISWRQLLILYSIYALSDGGGPFPYTIRGDHAVLMVRAGWWKDLKKAGKKAVKAATGAKRKMFGTHSTPVAEFHSLAAAAAEAAAAEAAAAEAAAADEQAFAHPSALLPPDPADIPATQLSPSGSAPSTAIVGIGGSASSGSAVSTTIGGSSSSDPFGSVHSTAVPGSSSCGTHYGRKCTMFTLEISTR